MYALACVSVSGRADSPECRCGKKMRSAGIESLPERSDTHIRIYDCPACHHEMRLTVWGPDVLSKPHRSAAEKHSNLNTAKPPFFVALSGQADDTKEAGRTR